MNPAPEYFLTQFSNLDWGIVVLYLLLTGLVGVWVNRYVSGVDSYMVGGRAAGWALNTASFIGTELGLVTLMYASIEAFSRGFSYLMIPIIGLFATFLIGQTGWVVNRFRQMELVTIPEFFKKRFGKEVQVVSASIMALAGILNMGLFPKMGATFLTYCTGLAASPDAELIVNIVMSLLIILVVVYTIMGGMVAVIITDYVQFVVLSIGLLLALGIMLFTEGLGWSSLVEGLASAKGIAGFNPFHEESYGWSYMIWMFVVYVSVGFSWGPTVSRALTAESPAAAQKTFLVGSPGSFIRLAIPALFAFGAFVYFAGDAIGVSYFFPDGVSGTSAHGAEAMPLFLGKLLPAGLVGIITAGLLAAFMSTHDSYFLCWASVISRDVIAPLSGKAPSASREVFHARLLVAGIGLFLLIWGLWYELPDSIWTYMAITGNVYLTGAVSAILGGIYWKKASRTGALAAMLGGLLSLSGLFIESISEAIPWFSIGVLGLLNYLICALLLIGFSLAFPDDDQSNKLVD